MKNCKITPDSSGKYRRETTEFSFRLCPSPHEGVGVFCTHGIRKGTFLRLFPGPETRLATREELARDRELAAFSHYYGIEHAGGCWIPHDFGSMEIGWFLNHSGSPNACRGEDNRYFGCRDISAGEEISIDYSSIE